MDRPNVVKDRRVERRVDAHLQIELSLDPDGGNETANTINISANGVYFSSPRYIEPLTKLGLRLFLAGDADEADVEAMDVEGVVVRVEPEDADAKVDNWDIACYFTDTSAEFRERLGRYVQMQF